MDLKLPHLGEGADSGTVVNLFVKEGDQITKDQALLELENEKAVATIPSTGSGTVSKVFVKAGDKISVGQRILSFDEGEEGRGAQASKAEAAPAASAIKGTKTAEAAAEKQDREKPAEEDEAQEPQFRPGTTPAASPSLRKLARDLGIDLTRVRGSQAGGRIVLED